VVTKVHSFASHGQPVDDRLRLEALSETGLLDTLPEESFDRYTRMVRSLLRVDVSLLSLVDMDRQFFKSQIGLPAPYDQQRQTPLTHSFCKLVVESGQALVVEDSLRDERVKDNLAVRDLGVLSYLGMPVRSEDGYVLGSICAIGATPRMWSEQDLANMRDLSGMVSTEIWSQRRNEGLVDALNMIEQAERDRDREARMLAHDLRTPLAAIISLTELTEMTIPEPTPEQVEYFQLTRQSCQTLTSLIGDLLVDVRDIGEERSPVSVTSLMRSGASLIRPLAEKSGLRLVVGPSPEGWVPGGKVRIVERILLNLLTNAVKFSPAGGRITLSVQRQSRPGLSGFRFEVRDGGPGVSDGDKAIIFEESVTGSAQRQRGPESHGLGLAFCRSAAARIGGTMGVEDSPEGGSIFYLFLPE